MANLQAADRVLVTVNLVAFGQRLMSTFCYGVSSLTPPVTQAQAFTALHTKLVSYDNLVYRYLACLCPEFEINEMWYQVISPSRYAKYTFTSGLGVGTFATGLANSANQAAVILRRGDLGNRSNVSTLHVPIGQNPACQNGGYIGPDIETPLETLADYLKTQVITASPTITFDPVINNGIGIGDFTPIVATSVKPTVRVMRRRTVGLGI